MAGQRNCTLFGQYLRYTMWNALIAPVIQACVSCLRSVSSLLSKWTSWSALWASELGVSHLVEACCSCVHSWKLSAESIDGHCRCDGWLIGTFRPECSDFLCTSVRSTRCDLWWIFLVGCEPFGRSLLFMCEWLMCAFMEVVSRVHWWTLQTVMGDWLKHFDQNVQISYK